VENDEILRKKVHLPSFDPSASRNVQLTGLKSNETVLDENTKHLPSFPRWFRHIAYLEPIGSNPEIVHFRVTNPGNFGFFLLLATFLTFPTTIGHSFCVSVNDKLPHGYTEGENSLSLPTNSLPVSYYSDGAVHAYGWHYSYDWDLRVARQETATYTTDDIISIWVDSFPKGSPPFSDSVSCPAPKKRTNPDEDSCDHTPFCAFFKNGTLVHDPFTLEGLVMPVFICVNFYGTTEKVEIVEAPFMLSPGRGSYLPLRNKSN